MIKSRGVRRIVEHRSTVDAVPAHGLVLVVIRHRRQLGVHVLEDKLEPDVSETKRTHGRVFGQGRVGGR